MGLFIPWGTLCALSLNRKVFRRILHGFDFYVKCVYALMLGITFSIDQIHRHDSRRSLALDVLNSFTFAVVGCLLVVIVSSLDALPRLPRRWKMRITMMWTLVQ